MNEANVAKFQAAYERKLVEAIRRSPEEWHFGEDKALSVAAKMTVALAKGEAHLGSAGKSPQRGLSGSRRRSGTSRRT